MPRSKNKTGVNQFEDCCIYKTIFQSREKNSDVLRIICLIKNYLVPVTEIKSKIVYILSGSLVP